MVRRELSANSVLVVNGVALDPVSFDKPDLGTAPGEGKTQPGTVLNKCRYRYTARATQPLRV